jgi:asparagine synthase (glutamine-hydrolysing)
MCGIAGFTHLDHPAEPGRMRRVTDTLHHRGPDQSGIWESEKVSLGAVRLKIIDLQGGDQPITSADGNTVIVFNGEVYNHVELRRELEQRGHTFRSHCDTEVVLKAFLEWDTDAFKRLRGMFAIALWQEEQQRLVLVRDRVGIKPLYFHQRGLDLYFGSELKAIFAHPEVDRRIDLEGLSYYLSLNYVPTPYTLVEGITKVRPGYWMEWRAGDIKHECYWTISLWQEQRHTLESAQEELHGLLQQSVREHLISDVPLGVWASGGLDSSTILHYAAGMTSQRLKTFSVSFRGKSFDESEYFRQVASHYGTEHEEFDLQPEAELPDVIEHMSTYADEPSADSGALPVWYLSQMCRKHVTVALSGEGADELFAGYMTYLADSYAVQARRIPAWIRRTALSALQLWPVSDDKISLEYKLKRFLTGTLLDPASAHLSWNGTHTDEERKRLYRHDGQRALRDLFRWLPAEYAQSGQLNQYLWADQRYYLTDDILNKCDRMSMAHSLEVRPPFLDHRLIEFANSLPENLKISNGDLKHILRSLMRDKLPAAVLNRPKQGFDIPTHHWFRTILKPLMLDTLGTPNGLFDEKVLKNTIKRHLDRKANLGYHLWGLLTLFLWIKRWNIQVPAARN